jgi:hypothetical protein
VLFAAILAAITYATAVDKNADTDEVSHLKLLDGCPDLGNTPNNLMPRNHWVRLGPPVTVHGVNVRVANALKVDVNANIFCADIAAKNRQRAQG